MKTADDFGYVFTRDFANGLRAGVEPLLYGKARAKIGPISSWKYGCEQVFDYDNVQAAIAALLAWDGLGEPEGWFRNPDTGRRRPNNDPAQEYIRP